jgi:hypothetical protein
MLLIMLAHYDVDSIGRDSSTSAVFAVEEVLDFVELMMMAKPKSRDTVLRALWSWLTSSNTKDLTLLSAVQLDTLVDEIESEWLDNQTAITKKVQSLRGPLHTSPQHLKGRSLY